MGFRGNTGRNYLVAQAFQPVRWNRLKPAPPKNSRGRLFHIFSAEVNHFPPNPGGKGGQAVLF